MLLGLIPRTTKKEKEKWKEGREREKEIIWEKLHRFYANTISFYIKDLGILRSSYLLGGAVLKLNSNGQ